MIPILPFIQDVLRQHGGTAGICPAAPCAEAEHYTGFTPFVTGGVEKRVNPHLLLPGVKTIIAAALPHPVPELHANGAVLSSLGAFEDYHPKFKAILHQLAADLKAKYNCTYKVLVDSATLDERVYAERAGIGFIARNGMLTAPALGSFINIGLILTDIPFEDFSPPNATAVSENNRSSAFGGCPPNCRACITACPGRALAEGQPLNAKRCASYITQKEGELTAEEKTIMGRNLYGCDICRDVCPFNQKTPRVKNPGVDLNLLLTTPDEQLTEQIKHTAISWKGPKILKRNAQAIKEGLTEAEEAI